ncbi:serine palmitoyltransferase 1-like [Paramacrobiotus metropolitanus]|uniref:serine palmitoyltransferase 1-like n=1 Tax=Paramacrobiotus metropolitanus TaxID=2943436 RepID=UPI002445C12A|nr:serine palmitoyltransferase 1-like [Paramacrobiotus metropolitanus]
MLRFSKTIFIPLIAFPILIATHGFQNKGPSASWVEHILGTSWLHFLFEISLTVYIVFLGVHGMKRASTNVLQESLNQLTAKEKETLIKEWKPDPLVPVLQVDKSKRMASHRPQLVCEGKVGKYVKINGRSYLNLASYNILNFVGNSQLEEVAKKTIKSYGVGSCGPRGFYGTMDVHLQLEEKLAQFMECEEAILYSYGTATISSAIPAYAKRGDLIFVDEGVNYAIQQGLTVSRSTLKYFRHNDLKHLESLLEDLQRSDQIALNKPRRKFFDRDDVDHPSRRRVFLVVEGLYANYGDLSPLPQLIALKKRYKFRIFLDETYSIGIVGRTGRGVTEHFGVKREDVDLIAGSLEHSLGSTGGFCCGSSFIIDHQRLSGLGYCFSASLPPLLASAASAALDIVANKPEMFEQLEVVSLAMHKRLSNIPGLVLDSWDASPIKHLRLQNPNGTLEEQYETLNRIVEHVFQNSRVVILTAKYSPDELIPVTPSIRVIVNVDLSEDEMDQAVDDLKKSCAEILSKHPLVQ